MGRVLLYYSAWQEGKFQCQHCGCSGNVGFADLDYSSNPASIIECPKCYGSLAVVEFPNMKDTQKAAAQGNAEAVTAPLGFNQRVNHTWRLLERFEQKKILAWISCRNWEENHWSSLGISPKYRTVSITRPSG